MSNHINSAFRVLEILENAKNKGEREKVADVWASVFGIGIPDQTKRNFEISRCLNQLHDEVEIVRHLMSGTNFESKLYDPWLQRLSNIFAIHTLSNEWQGIKNIISGEVLLCLGFCQQILPDEESLIEEQDLKELKDLLDSLEAKLDVSTLPEFTQKIIRNHVDNIRSAFRSYNIVGAKALQAAIKSAIGEVVTNEAVFADAKESEEITKVGIVLSKLHQFTEAVVKSEKVVSATVKLAQHGTKALEIFEKLI